MEAAAQAADRSNHQAFLRVREQLVVRQPEQTSTELASLTAATAARIMSHVEASALLADEPLPPLVPDPPGFQMECPVGPRDPVGGATAAQLSIARQLRDDRQPQQPFSQCACLDPGPTDVALDAHHRSPFRLRKALPMHQTRADSQRGIGTSGNQLKVKIAVSDDSVIRCWFLVTRCCLSTCTCPGLLRIGGLLPPFWLSNTACCSGVGDGSAGSRE